VAKTIGQQLAIECKKQGLTTEALCRVTGIGRRQVHRLFTTVGNPDCRTVIIIGHVIGLRVLPPVGNAIGINVLPEVLASEAKRRNYTLRELAVKAGRSHTTIRTLLDGGGSWSTCLSVMDALGWKVLWPTHSLEGLRRKRKENQKF
jgi:DNA-binding phage protein